MAEFKTNFGGFITRLESLQDHLTTSASEDIDPIEISNELLAISMTLMQPCNRRFLEGEKHAYQLMIMCECFRRLSTEPRAFRSAVGARLAVKRTSDLLKHMKRDLEDSMVEYLREQKHFGLRIRRILFRSAYILMNFAFLCIAYGWLMLIIEQLLLWSVRAAARKWPAMMEELFDIRVMEVVDLGFDKGVRRFVRGCSVVARVAALLWWMSYRHLYGVRALKT